MSTRRNAKMTRANLMENWRTVTAYWDRNAWALSAAISILSVFIATSLNQNIAYANDALCDPWYFFGINQDYFHLRSILGDEYQFDRYPAILPWIFLGPHLSAAALTETKFWTYFLIVSGCFSYAAVKLLGNRIGPLVAILFLCSTLSFLAPLSTGLRNGGRTCVGMRLHRHLDPGRHLRAPCTLARSFGRFFAQAVSIHTSRWSCLFFRRRSIFC